jgi:hypothetical protein
MQLRWEILVKLVMLYIARLVVVPLVIVLNVLEIEFLLLIVFVLKVLLM